MKLLSILLLIGFSLFAQQKQYKFRQLTVQQGLSRNWVRTIFQDKYGFYWFGTADGLNKYDGISFKIYKYKSNDKNTISDNQIHLIYEDKKGRLLVGTENGLNLYDREKDVFKPVGNVNNFVSSIYEIDENQYLIGSPGGLYLCNTKNFATKQIHNNLSVEKVFCDRNNNIWLATYNGLYYLDKTDFSCTKVTINSDQQLAENNLLHTIFQDSRGGIWLGTNSDGLWNMTYNITNPYLVHIKAFKYQVGNRRSINNGAIYSITESSDNQLWIGVENGGVNLLNLNDLQRNRPEFTHFEYDPLDFEGISDNSIHAIYQDRQNTMWVGTYGGGVSYQSNFLQKFESFRLKPGSKSSINNNRVNAIYEEADKLFIGTELGLNILDKKTNQFQYFTNNPSLSNSIGSNAVWSICRDNLKNLWVGLWNGGLNLFNEKTKTFKRFYHNEKNPQSIGSNSMLDILQSKDNHLWIATMRGGLNKLNIANEIFTRYEVNYQNKKSISSSWVNDIMESSDGLLWISNSQAVDIFDRKTNKFQGFNHNPANPKSISYNGAIVLFEDSKKHIWIGTGNGLNLFDKKDSSFTHFNTSNGLPNNTIQAIEEDNSGNLWISTNHGISKMVKAIDLPLHPKFVNYNSNDGLQGNEFIGRSSFKNSAGEIYFGGSNGYNKFDPNSIKSNPYVPKIAFTNLLLFNKPVVVGQKESPLNQDISVINKISLLPSQSVFTLEFASLNVLAPENNQYAYYLEGFESKWNFVGNQHSATYTNLDPGTYIFKVKATNNDGLWNNQGISLEIEILPSWWQTWWAKLLYLIAFVTCIYYFRRHTIISINVKNKLQNDILEKQKAEELGELKNQFFTNVSHELRTPVTLIIGPLSQLMHDPRLAAQLQTVYQNAKRLKTLVDQVLDFSKIEKNMIAKNEIFCDLIPFTINILKRFSDGATHKSVNIIFKSNVSNCSAFLDEDKLEKVLANLLSNALKFTAVGGKIIVDIQVDIYKNTTQITIKDNGQGIPENEINHVFDRFFTGKSTLNHNSGTGIGLNFTKKIVELLGGIITVSSTENEGAEFIVNLPIRIEKYEYDQIEISIKDENKFNNVISNIAEKTSQDFTILIIDDNPEICQYIAKALDSYYNVNWQLNPLLALENMHNYLPDLILCDVMMPDINGYQFCENVKSDIRFSHIPIILLTAKSSISDYVLGYNTEADDYITKPFEIDILKARIGNLIRKKEKQRLNFLNTKGVLNPKIQVNELDKAFMEQIIKIINEKYCEPQFNVNQIIEIMAMSRSVFYKKFKALSNQSINDLINSHRLEKAKNMLESKMHSVSQVAYECGFSDPAYFSRVFKEYYNQTPKDTANVKFLPINEN
jgi:signal transduction histidine kinase/ligand-binding sensor domain-containing protein/AraC-like DNA-binding protein